VQRGKVGFFRKDSQANRVYFIHDKSITLCGDAGGGAAKMGQYLFGCITPDRVEKRQNGQRFNEGRKFFQLHPTELILATLTLLPRAALISLSTTTTLITPEPSSLAVSVPAVCGVGVGF
jgi:hypothetical protein